MLTRSCYESPPYSSKHQHNNHWPGFLYFNKNEEPRLTILLRCQTGISGTLSIEDTSKKPLMQNINLYAACQDGNIKINDYQPEQDVLMVFIQNEAKQAELLIQYAENIQVDRQDGYYTVVKVSNMPPFIANDTI